MIDEIRAITAAAEPQVAGAATLDALADVERSLVGKGSLLVALKKQLGGLDADERRTAGGALNQAQADLRALVDARRAELEAVAAREEFPRAAPGSSIELLRRAAWAWASTPALPLQPSADR